jgi:hypothetical protein
MMDVVVMKNCSCASDPTRSIHAIEPAERLVLWSLRYWMACKRQNKPSAALLYEVYANNRMAGAAEQLDALMTMISTATVKPLDIRCTACPMLSADERAVLDAVAAGGERRLTVAGASLEFWLPPAALRIALDMIERFALTLACPGREQSST